MENNISNHNLSKIQSNIGAGNIYLDSYPFQVHFLMIDKCNVKCIMCGGDYFKSKSGRMITLEKFKVMATNLKLENVRAIVLAGAGDPLLNNDLVPIIQFVRKTYPHIAISVTTNGLGLSARHSELLLESEVAQVNISINSATRASYKRIMQVDGFDSVCKNAKAFVKQRNMSGRPVALQFSAAINRLNIEELPRLVELGREIGINSINLFYTRFYPERIRHMNVDDPADRLENDASLFFHQQLSDEMVLKAKMLARQYGINFAHEPLFKDHASPCACTWAMTQLMVGFDGEIYPCGGSEVHFREKVENGIYDFGNALKSPVDAFWNSDIYRALRISSRQGAACLIPECNCCANTISPNDIRSHIMQWDQVKPGNDNQSANKALVSKPGPSVVEPPLVSVIVPTFNRPGQLVAAIKSILAQTYAHTEIIVVNDCGSDIEQIVSSLKGNNAITYVKHGMNRGLAAARNTGIKVARGKYIAYLDDDDLFYPGHVETLVGFLESGEYEVAYTDAYRAHQEKKNGEYVVTKRDVPYSFEFDYDRILTDNFVPVLCFMHLRSCVDDVGLFDESLKRLEDWDMWIRMSRKFKFAHIKELTCEFAWRNDGTTMTSGQFHIFNEARQMINSKYSGAQPYSVLPLKASAEPKASLTSIIILTHNQIEHTKLCLQSIEQYTPQTYELILVDNGSTDGTLTYYSNYTNCHDNVRVIVNKENLGFAAGNNQGLALASGNYVLLLNNDTVVTEGWLARMLSVFERYLEVGIVGPMSNYVTGPQQVREASYRSLEEMHHFAKQWSADRVGQTMELQRVVGFCLLAKREVIDRIGGLDEQFGIGNFEDDDFCLRALAAGYKARIAQDVFIHHTGSQTFKGAGIDCQQTGERNWEIFKKKWKLPQDLPIGVNYTHKLDARDLSQYYIPLKAQPGGFQTVAAKEAPSLIHSEFVEGMTSIIIPVQSVHLNECVESLKKYTDVPHEIILLEHGASPKLKKQIIKAIKGNHNYKFIKIDKHVEFTQSLNEGINQSAGEYIVILFDDVVVSENWLSDMLECLNNDKKIGVVGVMSDEASNQQRLDDIDFQSPENRISFREKNWQKRIYSRYIDGFCILFTRELMTQIGLFDRIFDRDKHMFDDICIRAVLEGYTNIIAGNVFVHNQGTINRMLSNDKTVFDEKWMGVDLSPPLPEDVSNKSQSKAFYELFLNGYLKNQSPAILFSPMVDPHLICDLSDLSRFQQYIKDNGADIPDSSIRLFHDTGLSEKIRVISSEDLKKVKDGWDILVLTNSDLIDQNLENFLILANFKLLVVSDGLDSIDEARRVKLMEYFSVIGFEKIHENPVAFHWRNKSLWGEYLFSKGLTVEALRSFEQALADEPSDEDALNNLGVISYQLKQYEAAEEFLVKAVGFNRRNQNSLHNLIQLYVAMERFEDAAGLLMEMIHIEPEKSELHTLLGLCQEYLDHGKEVRGAYQKAEEHSARKHSLPERMIPGQEQSVSSQYIDKSKKKFQKILVINNLYPPQEMGGYGRLLFDFTNILRKRGHSIYVLTSDTPYLGIAEGDAFDVHRSFELFGGWEGGACKAIENREDIIRIVRKNIAGLEQVLKEFRPDACLLGNIDFLSRNIMDPILDKKIPIIHHLGNQHPGYAVNETPKSRRYHLATASHWLKNGIEKQGYPLQGISVIYPGALVDEFRMRIPPALDKLRIAYASIVLPYKGPHILINALKKLNLLGIDFSCSIAGSSTDQGFVDTLKASVAESGLEDKIRFTGFLNREELKNLYACHNVLVFPSIVKEAFGISQVEAMAAGLTVVTSGTGGAKEIVEHGVSGIIFKTEDFVSLAEELIQLVKDIPRWQQIALAGQCRAIEEFDIERSADALESCFDRLLHNKEGLQKG